MSADCPNRSTPSGQARWPSTAPSQESVAGWPSRTVTRRASSASGLSRRAAVESDIATTRRAAGLLESALALLLGRTPREVYASEVPHDATLARLVGVPAILGR